MKPAELNDLAKHEPDKIKRIVVLEARAHQKHLDYAKEHGWPRGVDVPLTEGIRRRVVKGLRPGSTPRPSSMTEYIRKSGLLPEREIDRIIAATPTRPLKQGEILDCKLGFNQSRTRDQVATPARH